MSRFTIFLGGDLVPTPRLARQVAGSRLIAADSGMLRAEALGLVPELWLGDFDSVTVADRERFAQVPRTIFPSDKDKTDGELAADAAIEAGATELVLAGALGGPRADHAFLNLAAGLKLAERGVPTLLSSGVEEASALLPGRTVDLDLPDGTLFSVLAFSDLSGLTLDGAKWPLDAVEVPFGSSLTLSNRVRGHLRASLRTGRAMLLAHFAET